MSEVVPDAVGAAAAAASSPTQTAAATSGYTPKTKGPLCKVCNDEASGFHYGVDSCEGCKVVLSCYFVRFNQLTQNCIQSYILLSWI